MSNSDLTLSNLRRVADLLAKDKDSEFCDFLNSFDGDNIFEKFHNILKYWEYDVSENLDLNLNDKSTKVQITYLLGEMDCSSFHTIPLELDSFSIILGIPKKFSYNNDIFPIYELIYQIKFSNITIDMSSLSNKEKRDIIDNLPPTIYNEILDIVMSDNQHTITFSNKALSTLKFNMLLNDTYIFLKNLFSKFTNDNFREIIFHLSKRVDGNIIMNSSMKDILYYIDEFQRETQTQEAVK